MIRDILFVSILTLYPISLQIKSQLFPDKPEKPSHKYIKQSVEQLLLIIILLLLQPDSWHRLDFERVGRGIPLGQDILSGLATLFIVAPVAAFFPVRRVVSELNNPTYVMGYPVKYLPEKYGTLPLFVFHMAIGVIFEELLCRQFAFYGFYHVFGIRGDWLLLLSSLLFTVGHTYPRRRDYLFVLLTGLLLGKLFQSYGTIVLPMVLHFCLNSTMIVLVCKRIAKKN